MKTKNLLASYLAVALSLSAAQAPAWATLAVQGEAPAFTFAGVGRALGSLAGEGSEVPRIEGVSGADLGTLGQTDAALSVPSYEGQAAPNPRRSQDAASAAEAPLEHAAVGLPPSEVVLRPEDPAKLAFLQQYALHRDKQEAAHSHGEAVAPPAHEGALDRVAAYQIYKELFGDRSVADLERLRDTEPERLDGLLKELWSRSKPGAGTRPSPAAALPEDLGPVQPSLAAAGTDASASVRPPSPALQKLIAAEAPEESSSSSWIVRGLKWVLGKAAKFQPVARAINRRSEKNRAAAVAKRLTELEEIERDFNVEFAQLQGLPGPEANPRWDEREAIAMFNAYAKLDFWRAARFYERIFAAGRAPRIPSDVHSSYVLALNRTGRMREAIAEARRGLAEKGAPKFTSLSPQAWPFVEQEYLIGLGTAHKNRYLDRNDILERLERLRGSRGALAAGREDETARADVDWALEAAWRYYARAAEDPNEGRGAFPSLYGAQGDLLPKEAVVRADFVRDLVALFRAGAYEPWAEAGRRLNQADLRASLEFYERAYFGDPSRGVAGQFTQYAGSNVIRILIYLGGEANLARAHELMPLVRQSALDGNQNYLWPNAARFELDVLEGTPAALARARGLIPRLLQLSAQLPEERKSMVAHLARWLDLMRARDESPEAAAVLVDAIDTLQGEKAPAATAVDKRDPFTRAFDDSVVSFAHVSRNLLSQNNLRYKGIVPPSMVNYADLGVADEILHAGLSPSGRPILAEQDEAAVREWAKDLVARIYGLVDADGRRVFEDLDSPQHIQALDADNSILKRAIELMGSDVTGVGANNVAANILFGIADCRFANFTYHLLMERWAQLRRNELMGRINELMRRKAALIAAGQPREAAAMQGEIGRLLAELENRKAGEYVFMQATHNAALALVDGEKYKFARDEKGRLVRDSKQNAVEDHTFTLRVVRDADGNVVEIWFDDAWYHEFYDMKSKRILLTAEQRRQFAEAERGKRKFTLPMRMLTNPRAARPEDRFETVEVTFAVSKYSNPEGLIIPNRYSATDLHLLGSVVKAPENIGRILADPALFAAWAARRRAGLYDMLRNRAQAATRPFPDGTPERLREVLRRFPFAWFFLNVRGAGPGPNDFRVFEGSGDIWERALSRAISRDARLGRLQRTMAERLEEPGAN